MRHVLAVLFLLALIACADQGNTDVEVDVEKAYNLVEKHAIYVGYARSLDVWNDTMYVYATSWISHLEMEVRLDDEEYLFVYDKPCSHTVIERVEVGGLTCPWVLLSDNAKAMLLPIQEQGISLLIKRAQYSREMNKNKFNSDKIDSILFQ